MRQQYKRNNLHIFHYPYYYQSYYKIKLQNNLPNGSWILNQLTSSTLMPCKEGNDWAWSPSSSLSSTVSDSVNTINSEEVIEKYPCKHSNEANKFLLTVHQVTIWDRCLKILTIRNCKILLNIQFKRKILKMIASHAIMLGRAHNDHHRRNQFYLSFRLDCCVQVFNKKSM